MEAVQQHTRQQTLTFQLAEVEALVWIYLISEHRFHPGLKAEQPRIVLISCEKQKFQN